MDIDDFLKSFGREKSTEQPDRWSEIIVPEKTYVIFGDVGTGKSGLAYYLLERFSKQYNLIPASVGLPEDKVGLLPPNFLTPQINDIPDIENAIIFIDEAGIQVPIEDARHRQTVIEFLSLPRQRNQILLLSYFFPRLALGRYLPFFAAFLFKRPPYLLEFAGKKQGDELTGMMGRAEERFAEIPICGQCRDCLEHKLCQQIKMKTYVVAPPIRWQGLLDNPLPSFWSEKLSRIWAGTRQKQLKLINITQPQRPAEPEEEVKPTAFAIEAEYANGIPVAFDVADPHGAVIREREKLIREVCQRYPQVTPEQLKDWKITYFDYHARLQTQ